MSQVSSTEKVKKVVILGGGTAGWMAAAGLGKMMGSQIEVILVESDDIPTVGVGEATIPTLLGYHRLLGIDEQEFLKATQGTFKLGIEFIRWGGNDKQYFHSFGSTGKGFWAGDFHHIWLRGQEHGLGSPFSEYSLETQAALAGKFTTEGSPKLNYAYHLDAGLYAKFLRGFSESHGVKRIEGKVSSVNVDSRSGAIDSIVLASGDKVSGDLFIDCSGFKGLLIEEALHTGYEEWSDWLLCDSAVAVQTELSGSFNPLTQSVAHDAGWQWRIPLQNRMGNGFVYCSKYIDHDAAKELLINNVDGPQINEPRLIPFTPGKRKKGWNKNCVSLGLASGFIEPLESTSIHLIMTGVMRLMVLFPSLLNMDDMAKEYNRQLKAELEDIRDFIILHYCVGGAGQSPMWDYCRKMELPSTLQERLELFKSSGQIFKRQDELFRVDSWLQVIMGQGTMPKEIHPVAYQMTEPEMKQFLTQYHSGITKYVSSLPSQKEFIGQYCSSV